MKSDLTFEFARVQPGSYNLWAIRPGGAGGLQVLARLPIEVSGSNLDGVTVPAGEGLDLTGSVRVAGSGKAATGGRVLLLPAEGSMFPPLNGAVKDDGAFRIEAVGRDRYVLNFASLPAGTYVKSARLGSQDVLEKGLDLTQPLGGQPLEITLSPNAAVVEGLVQSDGKPAPGSEVTLVPDPIREQQPYLYRTVVANQDGRFSIPNVAPGDYRVYAWEDLEFSPLLDPDILKAFESKAVKVSTRENGREQVEVPLLKAEDAQRQ